ncbi:MAG TPA: phosphoribosylaminoimidazolesuccinocarboxamide synthase [Candidatus Thermoplasmatota archaeon]|nr:phosphoribosylaminoimidazolesuccinocarboxamide synthase [Candidatus Thermoplasmatota archaeon]
MQLLRTGKVKEVFEVSDKELEFRFSDNISVFDKVIPTQVPKKGETLCRTSAHWFEVVEKELGIPTHFLGLKGPDRMRVRRVEVVQVPDITPDSTSFLIPLEVICRHYVAGSLHDRLKSGKIRARQLGFRTDDVPKYGTRLPEPFLEFTTKLEKTDRELSEAEAQAISKLSDDEFAELKDLVIEIDALIEDEVAPRGLVHVDGKKEFGMDADRQFMLLDTFGTADEDRWWDKAAYEANGETKELSKEFVRQHYRATRYHEALSEARAKGRPEPPIPPLPPDVTRQVTEIYVRLYERITGKPF